MLYFGDNTLQFPNPSPSAHSYQNLQHVPFVGPQLHEAIKWPKVSLWYDLIFVQVMIGSEHKKSHDVFE